MKRDLQKSKVYRWESKAVAPHDRTPIPFAQVKSIVDYVWQSEGLEYPPLIEKLPANVKSFVADGCRTKVRFEDVTHTWIILHELAHAMSSTVEDEDNRHGALFLGLYMQLCSRYLRMNMLELAQSAGTAGLRFKLDAKPVWLD